MGPKVQLPADGESPAGATATTLAYETYGASIRDIRLDCCPFCMPAARILSVLEELQGLSAAVVNSSEDSAEEEGQAQNNMRDTQADKFQSEQK